ncbi:MAG: hypothetical protein GQ574_20705 [Crocinitomix sp.]|nr:hypothetical protein [Crocinitomix sp.]
MRLVLFSFFLLLAGISVSCKKDKGFTKNHLDFSQDTLLFDTVFTTVGSTTERFKIYNNNTGTINIDEIQLMGGEDSPFRINFDGVPGVYHENIELEGKDSLYGFVEVTLEVNNVSNPLVISDSIRFLTNGVNQYLKLDVWGQDAYFHANELVGDHIELWLNDKPHVLYGIVACGFPGLDSNKILTIPAGTQIHGHKDAQLIVYKSTLNITGDYGNEVVFQGDRLESFYDNVSGQWTGIRMIEASTSSINYAIIKNGAVGLQVDSTQSALTLNLTNTIIDNSNFFNLLLVASPNVLAENCQFGKAGSSSGFFFAGGTYNFRHCNFVNYWTGGRGGAAFKIKNYYTFENTTYVSSIIDSRFDNCIFYGNAANEIDIDTLEGLTMDFEFNASLMKREEIYEYSNYSPSVIWNVNPLFIDPSLEDFHLDIGSPLRNVGDPSYSNAADIEGVSRTTPNIGLYEL